MSRRRQALLLAVGLLGVGAALWWSRPEVSRLRPAQWAALRERIEIRAQRTSARAEQAVQGPGAPGASGEAAGGSPTPDSSMAVRAGDSGATPRAATATHDAAAGVESPPASAPEAPVPPPPPTRFELLRQPDRSRVPQTAAPNVVELQPSRTEQRARIDHPHGFTEAALVNLNPPVGAWYVLSLRGGERPAQHWHLALTDPDRTALRLDEADGGLIVEHEAGPPAPCPLLTAGPEGAIPLDAVTEGPSPYVRLCGGAVVLRRAAKGRVTSKEWAADFLRDKVRGGEKLTVFVRSTVFADSWRIEASAAGGLTPPAGDPLGPPAIPLDPARNATALVPRELGLELEGVRGALAPGQWRPVVGTPGAWATAVTAGLVDPTPSAPWTARMGALDKEEESTLVYLVAFDLDAFEVGFAVGTDHPRVGWSERALPGARAGGGAGPDGFADLAPLQRTGVLPASDAERVAATFTAGFKRSHGAFKYGALAGRNHGTHYGFIEQGVILSRLQPGLSTLYGTRDGTVGMTTWTEADDALVPELRFARQNGVPLVETPPGGSPEPGALLSRWGAGNWGGSQDEKLRTLRAGGCLVEDRGRRFLIYGWFSSATPGGMARVFLAQGCEHAMLLDMNALEHTYLALYDSSGGEFRTRHLAEGMKVLDKEVDGQVLPRFLAFADNRDFFYLLRRSGRPR